VASTASTNATAVAQDGDPDAVRLYIEAKHQAEIVWAKSLAKCGDTYVRQGSFGGRYFQYRHVSFDLQGAGTNLDEADRLNGITWWGSARMQASLERVSEPDGWFTDKQHWGEWEDAAGASNPEYRLRKVHNVWSVTDEDDTEVPVANFPSAKPACSDVPK
jgi:hypothetical protein